MTSHRLTIFCTLMAPAILVSTASANPRAAQWPQWGGPNRNFVVETTGLADSWPEDGPPKIWHRELGEGYSAITVDDGMLYTMYRKSPTDEVEYTIALDARTGATVWEHRVDSPFTVPMARYGIGPHSTPLVVGSRLFTVGANLALHCFDKKTGKVNWEHDLLKEYSVPVPEYGYASSPVAYGRTVILPIVGEDHPRQTIAAFDQSTGHVVWENQSIVRQSSEHCDYSSPIIINLQDEDQLVFLTNDRVIGLNPQSGVMIWEHPSPSQTGVNVSTPVFDGKDILFCSGAYDSGSRAFRLKRDEGKTTVQELWYNRKVRVHHGNAIMIDGQVYASSGDFGTALFASVNLQTGDTSWRSRGFSKTNGVYADGKIILLDEDGQLALTTVTPQGMTVHSQCKIADHLAWTVPSLVGTTLYVRDRKHIMAIDLG